ncbi:alpha/beta hydrolase-fold protein [Flavobacterium sp. I-SCBP12n]|uniref:Alpha/beta hydrolase-fold protein n=2 Tax=Flavobacterium TaxID=237 RepID=A0A9X2BJL9_9FLAO|nr:MULTISPECIES: alpha/beta hydrolase-fold protein [Flavobacterium]MBP4141034.1 alpha/beta hydrolase [Flavobacterium flabelliforme]MCK8140362.1 alpha/beta hydrolase-fold protein [Flavobacterium pygoscelis]
MKKTILLLLFSVSLFSQKSIIEFESKVLETKREITIGLPASFEKNPNKKYPLVILLDGDYLFDPFYGDLNYGAYWDDLPETIVIGISQNKNGERTNDSFYDPVDGVPTREGARFFEFLGAELLPFIEKKYPVAPFRIIAGHDITAGFLNFFLYKDNPIFDAYISLSPELATEMEIRIPEQLKKLKRPIYYYQSYGEGDLKKIQKSVQELDASIKLVTNPQLNYKLDVIKGASHYSMVLPSIPNALYHIFQNYRPITSTDYAEKIVVLESGYVDYLVNKYDVLYKNTGIKLPIRLNDFKAIEAAIIKNKAYSELDKLAEVANKYYPKSMLGDYELALMFEKMEDPKKAAKYYLSASQSEEISDLTKQMMLDNYDLMKSQIPKK